MCSIGQRQSFFIDYLAVLIMGGGVSTKSEKVKREIWADCLWLRWGERGSVSCLSIRKFSGPRFRYGTASWVKGVKISVVPR